MRVFFLLVTVSLLLCADALQVPSSRSTPRLQPLTAATSDLATVVNMGTDVVFDPFLQNEAIACRAKKTLKKGDVLCSIPVGLCLDAQKAKATLDASLSKLNLRTGDVGLIALLLLHEKKEGKNSKYESYVRSLPATAPGILSWSIEDLEELFFSSTRNFKAQIEAVDEDWKNLSRYPAVLALCDADTFRWALGVVKSRHFILDNQPALAPVIDFIPFDPLSNAEPYITGAGIFGGKVVKVVADASFDEGSAISISYGLKSSAECLEDHGFCPNIPLEDACAEFKISLDDATDKFYEDKFNILEQQKTFRFDIESSATLDKELLQVARLKSIDGVDAFILESVFYSTVFKTLAIPFSKNNEIKTFKLLAEQIGSLLVSINARFTQEQDAALTSTPNLSGSLSKKQNMAMLRMQERAALQGTLAGIESSLRILQTADSNEYYQERRLRELDLLRPLEDDEILE